MLAINGSHTGIVLFTDAASSEVNFYAGGPAIITLWDADLNTDTDSAQQASITVTGTTQTQPETVTLTETGVDTGIFRGTIAFDTASGVSAADGDLDVKPGDDLLVHYNDAADDYGNATVAEDSTLYAPVTYHGHITTNTTWTKANSPYIISGDLTIDNGVTLTLEPGVAVKFVANYDDQNAGRWNTDSELFVLGHLVAPGTPVNPIIFTSTAKTPQPGDWGQIVCQTGGTADMTYCQVRYGNMGIVGADSSVVNMTDCLVDQCDDSGIEIVGTDSHGTILRTNVQNCAISFYIRNGSDITLRNCTGIGNEYAVLRIDNANPLIEDCSFTNTATPNGLNQASAIYVYAGIIAAEIPQAIRGCTISGSYYGLRFNWELYEDPPATLLVENCTASGSIGVVVEDRAKIIMHGCDLSGSTIWGIHNNRYDQDCRYNYWGTNATNQMNSGGNPKNISFIRDKYDDAGLGYINYSGWLTSLQNKPMVDSVNPSSGNQGQTLSNVIITGNNFSGATDVSFGTGIIVSPPITDNSTQIRVNITISPGASNGKRDVSVTTPGGTGTKTDGFTVMQPTQSVRTSTGTGIATITTSNGSITSLTALASTPCGTVSGFIFPNGVFSFNITDIIPGATATVTITLPENMRVGTQYWECINNQWVNATSLLGDNDGDETLTLTIKDGGLGDLDGLPNGTIVHLGGPAISLITKQIPHQSSSPANPQVQIPHQSSSPANPQVPIQLPNISVMGASISATSVMPGTPVTVTASVANNGLINGTSVIRVYVNGQEDASTGVAIDSGQTRNMTFAVSRDNPGTYSVYVDSTPAGSFTVGDTSSSTVILVISAAAILISILGLIYLSRRRQSQF